MNIWNRSCRFYGGDISARQILSGDIPQPGEAQCLYDALEIHTENYIAYKDSKLAIAPMGAYNIYFVIDYCWC